MMPRLLAVPTLLALGLAAGCAKNPDAIPPVSMSGAFDGVDCARAATMRNATQTELTALEGQQRSAVAGDAVGVFLIGVPMSSLTGGDKAGEIGAAKGKLLALDARLTSCQVVGVAG